MGRGPANRIEARGGGVVSRRARRWAAHHAGGAQVGLALFVLLASAILPGLASAEATIQLRVGREPYYVGVPVDIHIQSTGFERAPEPTCSVEQPAGGRLQLVRVVPNFASSMQIVNGRVTRTETVQFTCQYQFTGPKAGQYRLGPFRVEQAGVALQSQSYAVKLQTIPVDGRVTPTNSPACWPTSATCSTWRTRRCRSWTASRATWSPC